MAGPVSTTELEGEIEWFSAVVDARLKLHFDQDPPIPDVHLLTPPDLADSRSPYGSFVARHRLTFSERLTLVLALIPHLRPHLLDIFLIRNETFDRSFTEFGGATGDRTAPFVATGETAAFLAGGLDLDSRFDLERLLSGEGPLSRYGVVELVAAERGLPPMKRPLRLAEAWLGRFTLGREHDPAFGADFPARPVRTDQTWDDLVLHPETRRQVREIETWLQHGETLMVDWGMAPKLRPGFRALFHGPPGTGKTLTASLLAATAHRPVYRIDLALVVSKYIGETEKNLRLVFDEAERRDWILFFDEADALFGRRTEAATSHDRYANQEISYLLQRVEVFDGVVILASNRRDDLDEAFARRFETIVHFPMPGPPERLKLWRQAFSAKSELEDAVDLEALARSHTLSGGSIMNAVRYASLETIKSGTTVIPLSLIERGIQREYQHEGR